MTKPTGEFTVMFLDEVRASLLQEARQSPNLLSDLAGLEQYIAESFNTRSLIELLQNADDAASSRFMLQRVGKYIFAANDGRLFTKLDFESLCRSAYSSKIRGDNIGYRGIGFKSVVGFAKSIHLFSSGLAATFSRERTSEEIPRAGRVPLIRIPHPVTPEERMSFEDGLRAILRDGYTTVFVFQDSNGTQIELEIRSFDFTSLLFLRNIRQLEFKTNINEVAIVKREAIDERTISVRLTTSKEERLWTVVKHGETALAFAHGEHGVCRLKEQEAVVHAFLPTEEPTGLAIKVNGDISTDLSRKHVILDEHTEVAIDQIVELIVDVMKKSFPDNTMLTNRINFLPALVPFRDPNLIVHQRRSFRTELLNRIRRKAEPIFRSILCRPDWLNPADYQILAYESRLKTIRREMEEAEGLVAFVHFLGAKDAKLCDLSNSLSSTSISITGCAEIVSHLVKQYVTGQIDITEVSHDWRIWVSDGKQFSFSEVKNKLQPLDQNFVDLILEKVVGKQELLRFIKHLSNLEVAQSLLKIEGDVSLPHIHLDSEERVTDILALKKLKTDSGISKSRPTLNIKRWRSAEQQVMDLLIAQGYVVSDVSRQNLGYDLEGKTPEGRTIYIEVKSIEHPGQAFSLTNNEVAIAKEMGDAYFLAIVRQSTNALEVEFIQHPLNRLSLTRQCRQWVWECSSYDFQPERFPFE